MISPLGLTHSFFSRAVHALAERVDREVGKSTMPAHPNASGPIFARSLTPNLTTRSR